MIEPRDVKGKKLLSGDKAWNDIILRGARYAEGGDAELQMRDRAERDYSTLIDNE
jgi:hypothetical protein